MISNSRDATAHLRPFARLGQLPDLLVRRLAHEPMNHVGGLAARSPESKKVGASRTFSLCEGQTAPRTPRGYFSQDDVGGQDNQPEPARSACDGQDGAEGPSVRKRTLAFEQEDDLARELIRRRDASDCELASEPRFDSRFVAAGDGASGMFGQVR